VTEDPSREAFDHLQRAALEMIAAARAVLDVAEEAVRQPEALRDLLLATARAATQAASSRERAGETRPSVERIRIS